MMNLPPKPKCTLYGYKVNRIKTEIVSKTFRIDAILGRIIIVLLLICFTSPLAAQFAAPPKRLIPGQIPKTIKISGRAEEAWSWTDKIGENILLTSVQAVSVDKTDTATGEQSSTTALHAFHFVKKDSAYKLLWKLSDAERDCPLDLTAAFLKGSLRITDLDKDGIAETTVQYKLACRGDVSPAQMKLIMHEDTLKFGLRGTMWVKTNEESKFNVTESTVNLEKFSSYKGGDDEWEKAFGRYQNENDFKSAPPEFLVFARSQWLVFVKESFE